MSTENVVRRRSAFISVAHQDQAKGALLLEALRKRDTESWLYSQPYIGNFHDKIADEIRSCDVLIVLVSKNAIVSKWVKQEIALAMELDRVIVPVEIEPLEDADLRGAWPFLRASQNFLRLETDDPSGIDRLADCICRQLNTDDKIVKQTVSQGSVTLSARSKRSKRTLIAMVSGLVLLVICLIYFWLIPRQVNKSLADIAHIDNYQTCYEQAKSWQTSMLLWDKSIASYWRVASFQAMYYDDWFKRQDRRRIDELEQEYREAIARTTSGMKVSGLLYQYANFKRRTHDNDTAKQFLTQLQEQYPSSAWKEGTAYYLGQMAVNRSDLSEAVRQIQKLEAMSLDSPIFVFELGNHITVREGIAALRQQVATTQASLPAAER